MASDGGFERLVALCRRDASELDPGWLAGLDPAGRAALLDAAARHHVRGLALARLERLGGGGAAGPDGATSGLLRSLRRRAALLEMRCDRVVERLERAGVRAVVLKGSALAVTAYDEPVERDLGDLDVLVPADALRDARRALEADGYGLAGSPADVRLYRERHFHLPLVHPDRHVVELHWALHRRSDPFRVDPRGVLERAIEVRPPNRRPFLMPAAEDMLLHVTLQNLQDGFSRLSRIVDVDRILVRTEPSPEVLVRAARDGGLAAAMALSLQLAARLLGARVPAELRGALWPAGLVRLHVALFDPERLVGRQLLRETRARRRLLELWLAERGAWEPGTRLGAPPTVGHGRATTEDGPGPLWRTLFLGKIGLYQLFLYGAAAARGGRTARRFWSEPPGNG